jgi:predicted integral membrane protein DUF2269
MIRAYSILVFVHVLSALWVGVAAFGGTVLRASIKRAPDLAAKISILRAALRIGLIFGFGGGLAVGLTGLGLAFVDPAWLMMGWVRTAITLWAAMFALNVFYLAPRARRMLAAGEASLVAGAPTEEFQRLAANPVPPWLAELPALAVFVLVLLMVLKPF